MGLPGGDIRVPKPLTQNPYPKTQTPNPKPQTLDGQGPDAAFPAREKCGSPPTRLASGREGRPLPVSPDSRCTHLCRKPRRRLKSTRSSDTLSETAPSRVQRRLRPFFAFCKGNLKGGTMCMRKTRVNTAAGCGAGSAAWTCPVAAFNACSPQRMKIFSCPPLNLVPKP